MRARFEQFVVPSYARFELELERGEGSYVWDTSGRRYLDLGGGIAVCSLGHANPELADALSEQARRLVHVSNLYYTEAQARLAERLVGLVGPGRVFFCNSGAEANEGLYKLARKFGRERGRFEIVTAENSFHGRTLAGLAATGQEKVKKGFDPAVAGFKHVRYNDLAAARNAIGPETVALLIEPVQGESGVVAATRHYLLGLRKLCDEKNLLLLLDEVQCGQFRTGKFHAWQTILGDDEFLPDAISMAKGLGGGFPIGAFWVREKHANVLSAGTHATTFGGSPLGCAAALKVLELIERDRLADNARELGAFVLDELRGVALRFPEMIREARGIGLMIGVEFSEVPASEVVKRLHEHGLLTIPAGNSVVRLLPALNLKRSEAEEGLRGIEEALASFAK